MLKSEPLDLCDQLVRLIKPLGCHFDLSSHGIRIRIRFPSSLPSGYDQTAPRSTSGKHGMRDTAADPENNLAQQIYHKSVANVSATPAAPPVRVRTTGR